MRTNGAFQQATPVPDGMIWVPIGAGSDPSASGATTRIAAGKIAYVVAASKTAILDINLNAHVLARYGVQDYAQEQWGSTAAGGAQFLPTPPATFTTPYGKGGNPPFTGSSQLVPPTSRPKGFQINSVTFIYQTLGVALTTNTFGITSTLFVDNTAPAVTTVLATAAHGLVTTIPSTGPHVTTVAYPTPAMLVAQNTEYNLEWNIATPSGSTVDIYGLILNVSYNYN